MLDVFSCHYINDQEMLTCFSERLLNLDESSYVAFDTEFTRNRTFYPILELLQFAVDEDVYFIDPHAENLNLKDFFKVFSNIKSTVLLFAAAEDLEILVHEGRGNPRYFPKKIVDLQSLYAFLNISYNIGLKNIVEKELGITLLKEETHSDWSLRPLSESQLRYAKEDVIYLLPLYQQIMHKFKPHDCRLLFYEEYMSNMLFDLEKEIDPEHLYMFVKGASSLNKKELKILQYLCKWRYEFARAHNIAPNWIITNGALCNLCKENRLTFKTLIRCGVKYPAAKTYGELAIRWHEQASLQPDTNLYSMDYFINLKENEKSAQKLKTLLLNRAHTLNIAKELLCNRLLMNDFFYCRYFHRTPILETSWYQKAIGPINF